MHVLDELGYRFSVMGITETRISNANSLDYNASIPGYKFEYTPTPLAAGRVGMYIDEDLNYTVIEKASENAFQALWIEIQFPKQANVICGVVYRQHNSPERFLEYFDQTLEKLSASGKSIYIMGDFNVNLLRGESCKYSHNFLPSLQSYSFIPTIDKPTRVYRNSATLIDNILVNNVKGTVSNEPFFPTSAITLRNFVFFIPVITKSLLPDKNSRLFSPFRKHISYRIISN